MRIYFSREEEFAERFKRSLGFWFRALSTGAVVLLVLGGFLGIGAFWNDNERLPIILLLTAIGLFGNLCYVCLLGLMAELAYLNERLAKRSDEPA